MDPELEGVTRAKLAAEVTRRQKEIVAAGSRELRAAAKRAVRRADTARTIRGGGWADGGAASPPVSPPQGHGRVVYLQPVRDRTRAVDAALEAEAASSRTPDAAEPLSDEDAEDANDFHKRR